jgi:two-component system cell cycle response regulator
VSIGVAQSGGSDDSAEAILKRADEGLYDAKRSGRNRVIEHAA